MKKAMILAAGKGSRMGKIGEDQPKALLKIGHVCLLQHVIGRLLSVGVESIVINLHHLAGQIVDFVEQNNNFGIDIQFSLEKELLETGGGVKRAAPFFEGEDSFIVHNADVYSEIDLNQLVASHRTTGADATLVMNNRQSSRRLLFDQRQHLVGWRNLTSNEEAVIPGRLSEIALSFCGIHVISKQLLEHLVQIEEDRFSIITAYLRLASSGLVIMPHMSDGEPWFDVGTPEKLKALESYLSKLPNIV